MSLAVALLIDYSPALLVALALLYFGLAPNQPIPLAEESPEND